MVPLLYQDVRVQCKELFALRPELSRAISLPAHHRLKYHC